MRAPLTFFLLVGACGGEAGDSAAVLPPAETGETGSDADDSAGTFPFDTSGDSASSDDVPSHWLTMREAGLWVPEDDGSGVIHGVSGQLEAREVVDGDEEAPACDWVWTFVGTAADSSCDDCDYTMDVTFTRDDTLSTGACRDPELPATDEQWRLGYAAAEATIWFDYYGTGVWVPLYDVTVDSELGITFSWERTIAVDVPEEDG
jgi:hypothetical protein